MLMESVEKSLRLWVHRKFSLVTLPDKFFRLSPTPKHQISSLTFLWTCKYFIQPSKVA